jgi:hypothetical protein
MDTRSGIFWPNLWEGPQELSSIVTAGFKRQDKEGLRGASRAARTAANATVSKVQITKEEDLRDLPQLKLEERFPRIASVSLKGCPQDGMAVPFAQFALDTLAKLPKLTFVDLSDCNAFDAASACAALVQCSQVQELSLPKGARTFMFSLNDGTFFNIAAYVLKLELAMTSAMQQALAVLHADGALPNYGCDIQHEST